MQPTVSPGSTLRARAAVVLGLLLLAPAGPAAAQGTKADYERAAGFWERYGGLVNDTASAPEWIDGGPRFWYLAGRADRTEFVAVDPRKGEKAPAFDHAKLAQALAKASGEAVDPKALPFTRVRLDGGKVRCRAFAKAWAFDPATGTIAADPNAAGDAPAPPRRHPDARAGQFDSYPVSPDGKSEASIDTNFNVTIRNRDTDAAVTLTADGTERDPYLPEFYWSPDSTRLVVMREAGADKSRVALVESAPPGGGRPRPAGYDQPLPGDKLARRRPHLLDVRAGAPVAVADTLFADPYDLSSVRWDRNSQRFTFLYNPRGHRFLRVVAVDAATGKASALFEERSATFVDYVHKLYLRHLDATGELLWASERDGWNHLYLLNAATGAVTAQLTKGAWLVRRVDRVDAAARRVWFWAHGVRPEQDPYHLHYCRVNLDGTGLVVLTEGDGTHEVWTSPDRDYFVDAYSRVDAPPVTELRRAADGKLVLRLESADITELLKAGWRLPERFVAKGRDGKTDVHGVILRPSNFDPKKKYPVVEDVYASPTEFHAPKAFAVLHDPLQSICELGFVGVMVDGMGTNWRGKAFHDVCWKNVADGGFPDRIGWLKAAAAKHPEMDLSRVGIYGGSAGGRNALRALIAHSDTYAVAVADCGNHDDRFHHIWYGELWMGHPVGPHYAEQSNVVQAHKMKGKLFLIAGELDRNVDPAHTLRVADALIKADKDFDLLVVPGGAHCPAESPYGSRRRMDFLVRHLHGVEPRAR
jgi:dipeptidyl aminopeptidase/acylaminoacyl peptidase